MQSTINTLQSKIQFSQASLQDFVDCRRRFQLRYLYRLAWPALEAEPAVENERAMQQGALFHHMIQQHLSGVPVERLDAMASAQEGQAELEKPQAYNLARWWQNYLAYAGDLLSIKKVEIQNLSQDTKDTKERLIYPEVTLFSSLAEHRVVAVYDLILVNPGQSALILDWKTSRKRTARQWLSEKLQTRIYPYLLVKAGAHLNKNSISVGRQFSAGCFPIPEQIEMIYWFAEYPADPERFTYDTSQFRQDEAYLTSLIQEISALGEADFPLTTHFERCHFCTYRSLCERGVRAGSFDKIEDSGLAEQAPEQDFDFEQVGEIAF